MKKSISFLLPAIVFSVFLSCNKDEDLSKSGNHFSYDGKKYTLAGGAVLNYGEFYDIEDIYNFDIVLFSEGFEFNGLNGDFEDATGTGHILYFELNTSNELGLVDGDYDAERSANYLPFTYSYSDFSVNYNVVSDSYEIRKEIVSGKISIKRTGNSYELTILCKSEDGKDVKGYYKGALPDVNMIDWDLKLIGTSAGL